MKGVVYGWAFEDAEIMLNKIVRDYEFCKINTFSTRRSKNLYEVQFENGDIWNAVKAASSCGRRYNVAYIDRHIPTDIKKDICIPAASLPPYQAIHYYWGEAEIDNSKE